MKGYDFDIELERAIQLSPSIAKEQKDKIAGMKFGTKYLVFDFDFQERTMTDLGKIKALEQMLAVFNNDSENGLLFINYPMFESFQEVVGSQAQYEETKVKRSEFGKYKRSIADRNLGVDCKAVSFANFKSYILTALRESNFLFHGAFGKKLPYKEMISDGYGLKLFSRQIEELQEEGLIYPINSSVLIPLFYFGHSKYKNIS